MKKKLTNKEEDGFELTVGFFALFIIGLVAGVTNNIYLSSFIGIFIILSYIFLKHRQCEE